MNSLLVQNRQQQQGAALIIGLLILLVMTVIGVSALNTTTMDSRIASNVQNANVAFQIADSSGNETRTGVRADEIIKDCAIAKDQLATPTTHDVSHNNLNNSQFESDSAVKYTGQTTPPEGFSLDEFAGYGFDVDSTGQVAGTNTAVTIKQGLVKGPYPKTPPEDVTATCPNA